MRENGIIRKVDDLGRFVLPKDVRKKLNIRTGDFLELTIENDSIQMRKYSCIKELDYISHLIIDTVYELYKIEMVLIEDKKILIKREGITDKKISKLIDEKNYLSLPIIFEGKETSNLIALSKNEKIRPILEFATLFLSKYLE